VTACQAIIDRVESDYKGSLTEQNQMMTKAMKQAQAGHMIGSWSFKYFFGISSNWQSWATV
jgi:hypothetical protein